MRTERKLRVSVNIYFYIILNYKVTAKRKDNEKRESKKRKRVEAKA